MLIKFSKTLYLLCKLQNVLPKEYLQITHTTFKNPILKKKAFFMTKSAMRLSIKNIESIKFNSTKYGGCLQKD